MFLKRTRSKNHTYLALAETYREDGKVKHRIIAQLGREDQVQENNALERLISSIVRVAGTSLTKTRDESAVTADDGCRVNLAELREESRQNWGAAKIYRTIWDELGISQILQSACSSDRRELNLSEITFLVVLSRLIRPSSKLKVFQTQEHYLGTCRAELHHLYRALDHLAIAKDEIEAAIYHRQRTLFSLKIDVVFYDVTTLYFESVRGDDLRDFGYSKDAKFGEVQVVVGLLVDGEGRPVGFDVFPGNTFERRTLETALRKLKQRFDIRHVIIVADRGINSKVNLHAIKEMGYDYIVGSRIRNLPSSMHSKILALDSYQPLPGKGKDLENETLYKILPYDNITVSSDSSGKRQNKTLPETIVCTWSRRRAEKDKADRDRLIQKAQELVEAPSKIHSKRGARKFIKQASDSQQVTIDEQKIIDDSRWDGFYGIQSSASAISPTDILDAYHTLWKIEESFRILKSTLETRPVFHWTPSRIKGHLVTCFLAFLLERTLEIKLKSAGLPTAPEQTRQAIDSLEVSSIVFGDNKRFYLPAKGSQLARQILKALSISIPSSPSYSPPV